MDQASKTAFVFGGSGKTGTLLLKKLLSNNYQVKALTRNLETAKAKVPGVEWIQGDVFQPQTFSEHLKNQRAVFSCVGADGIKGNTTVFSQGLKNIVEEMEKQETNRFVVITAAHDHPDQGYMFKYFVKAVILNQIFADIDIFEKWLKNQYKGNVQYTLLRPFQFQEKGDVGKYVMVESNTKDSKNWNFKTIIEDLADSMVNVFENNLFINKFVDVGNKK